MHRLLSHFSLLSLSRSLATPSSMHPFLTPVCACPCPPLLFLLSCYPQAFWLPASYARLPYIIFEAPVINHPDFGSTGPRIPIAAGRHTRKVWL